jgi:hypothetical protein
MNRAAPITSAHEQMKIAAITSALTAGAPQEGLVSERAARISPARVIPFGASRGPRPAHGDKGGRVAPMRHRRRPGLIPGDGRGAIHCPISSASLARGMTE